MGLGHKHHTNCLAALNIGTENKDTLISVIMHGRSL